MSAAAATEPNAAPPGGSLVPRAEDDAERLDVREHYRLTGEDAPAWLPLGFALIGIALGAAALWLFLSSGPSDRAPVQREYASLDVRELGAAAPRELDASLPAAAPPRLEPRPATLVPALTRSDLSAAEPPRASDGSPALTPETAAATPVATSPATASGAATARLENCPAALRILFQRGRAKPILPGGRKSLQGLRDFLARHPETMLSIEGHADAAGSDEYNLLLSYRRAKAVGSVLSAMGLAEERMTIRAAGKDVPLPGAAPDAAENRRVLLQVLGNGSCRSTTKGDR